jgi:hypothetical protein
LLALLALASSSVALPGAGAGLYGAGASRDPRPQRYRGPLGPKAHASLRFYVAYIKKRPQAFLLCCCAISLLSIIIFLILLMILFLFFFGVSLVERSHGA